MPKGSLIPQDVKGKLGMIQKIAPPEISKQIKILADAERSFVIPIKITEGDKQRYLIIAGILLKDKVSASPSFDAEDIQLLKIALEKAIKALGDMIPGDNETEGGDDEVEEDDTDETEDGGNEQ